MATLKISPEVKDVLRRSFFDGVGGVHTVTLPDEKLDRKLYVKVNEVLMAAGGKWNKKLKAHIFKDDPTPFLELAIDCPLSMDFVDLKKDLDFFETPPELAQKMVKLAEVNDGSFILEPSIGMGGIARYCPTRSRVFGYEVHLPFVEAMRCKGYTVYNKDFLTANPCDVGEFITHYDAVIMNPPFHNGLDIAHVTHALNFVRLGSLVVALTCKAWTFRKGKKWDEFRQLVKDKCLYPLGPSRMLVLTSKPFCWC
jgi:predicted RNA methylase